MRRSEDKHIYSRQYTGTVMPSSIDECLNTISSQFSAVGQTDFCLYFDTFFFPPKRKKQDVNNTKTLNPSVFKQIDPTWHTGSRLFF